MARRSAWMHRATFDLVWLGVLILTRSVACRLGRSARLFHFGSGWACRRVVGSGRSVWCQGGLEQLGPGLLPRPVLRQVHPEAAGGAGQPSRDVDQLGAGGTGGGFGVEGRGQAAGGAGEVERDRGQHQPGAARRERTRRKCASGPLRRSAWTCSMIACARWVFSAWTSVSGLSVNTAW